MPELPEVERVRQDLQAAAVGRTIARVETTVDEIVFDGVSSAEFEQALVGRKVLSCERRGKNFFLVLDGDGMLPVMHLGMTGRVNVLGQQGLKYQEGGSDADSWPPKWVKFVLHLSSPGSAGDDAQVAFSDPRRLGRIRLRADPLNEPPLSLLGPDPIVNPPTSDEWAAKISTRRSPIKSVLLDQTVAAGIGNWVADEILFHSRLHPSTVASTLSAEQVEQLRLKTLYVCQTAVGVGADASLFPDGWLMRHRWGKGKKKGLGEEFRLADGTPAVVEFITIGGRTSAFVKAIQPPPSAPAKAPKAKPSKASTSRRSMSSSPLSPPPEAAAPAASSTSAVPVRAQRAAAKRKAQPTTAPPADKAKPAGKRARWG